MFCFVTAYQSGSGQSTCQCTARYKEFTWSVESTSRFT